jgi:hypothetical protein
MRRHSTGLIRLVASDGELLADPPPPPTSRGWVDLTVQEIRPGHVVCTGDGDAGTVARTYTVAAEEALLLALRSLLSLGDQSMAMRMNLDAPRLHVGVGPIDAVANAVRLGERAMTATVTLRSGGDLVGRGSVVCLARPVKQASRVRTLRAT